MLQVYEPVQEGSYIKMIDMVSGQGGQIQVSYSCYFLEGCRMQSFVSLRNQLFAEVTIN